MVSPAAPRASGLRLFRRILREQRGAEPQLAAILLLGLVAAPLALLPALAMKIAVDGFVGGAPLPPLLEALVPEAVARSVTGKLVVAAALLVGVTVVSQLLSLARRVITTSTQARLMLGLLARIFPHLGRLSLSWHDRKGASDSTYRVLFDTAVIPEVVLEGLLPFLASLATLTAMSWMVVHLSWPLAVVALLVAPALMFVSWPFGARLRRQWHDVKALNSSAMSLIQEVLSGMRVVKAFGQEEAETARLLELGRQSLQARVRVSVTHGWFDLFMATITAVGTAAVLGIGAAQVKSGALTLGELAMVGTLLAQLYAPLHTIVGQIASLQSSLASAERALALLDEVPQVVERPDARSLGRAQGAVEFRGVGFAYEGEDVLHDVSFAVRPGARVGIAGHTGAGKTTLMSLLNRFYDPSRGAILLDGVDLRDLRLDDLRRQFSIVLQDPFLFHKSVFENIRYSRPEASREDVVAAARLANAHDFIAAFPEGYETVVGERGMRLSGGERQRIALARAFLKDAPILILDEPTSSVDVRTERAILDAVERLMRGRTTFIIAHRTSTLASCDRVLVLERGRLVLFAAPDSVRSLEELLLTSSVP